jgi:hypothetical protein
MVVDDSAYEPTVTAFARHLNALIEVLQRPERAPGFSLTLEIKDEKRHHGCEIT